MKRLVKPVRFVLRHAIYITMRASYRLRVHGREHLPARGAALVVCNHVSFMDALVLGGASPRPLRFVMDQPIYDSPWLKWWFLLVGAIPVESERRTPAGLRRTLGKISEALRDGEVVMIFPEGRLTPDGEVQAFRRGLETMLSRDNVPVVPAGLAGLWGSWASRCNGPAFKKWPRRFRARVQVTFGPPIMAQEAQDTALRHYLQARVVALKAAGEQDIARREQAGEKSVQSRNK
ncbi:1-acyl-sn-glycerol-3-phosphate acyltransferase [Halomonas sp. GD1P12]|uniref:1-acyl-sn-glycerol-3-phosphate acyltransferase n=1 Tax=Halomonas sp. GD1P12 TaxID=2982691 RepID=UPI0021E3EE6C|nr:1-acyl-sn-glycerol-3-phosphate acyltransferase [Halomonas sp. GD1P12]UYF99494.1 1-acyl-sn-glycerol-3-phosphate acyltransferase [Halomonas sp. GD1P12]